MLLLIFLLLGLQGVHAGDFRFGLRGGVPNTDVLRGAAQSFLDGKTITLAPFTSRYAVGPAVEFGRGRVSLEVSLLYKRFGYDAVESTSNSTTTFSAIEAPIAIKKYRGGGEGKASPYVAVGVVVRKLLSGNYSDDAGKNGSIGGLVGFGIQKSIIGVVLNTELRYTRWGGRPLSIIGTALQSNLNQAEVLCGFSF